MRSITHGAYSLPKFSVLSAGHLWRRVANMLIIDSNLLLNVTLTIYTKEFVL